MSTIVRPGLMPLRRTLSNGTVLVAKESHTTPAVAINLAVRAGSIHDPLDAAGLASFVGRTIDRGTERQSAEEIAEELDDRGIALSVTVTRHATALTCTCLAEDLLPVLALLGDIVRRPSFPAGEVERRRAELLTGLLQDEDNPAVRAVEALLTLLYGTSHPYGRPAKGTRETVERFEPALLTAFHRRHFVPSGVSLVVVGDIDPESVAGAAGAIFGDWRGERPPDAPLPAVPAAVARRHAVIPMMNKAQADIAYGFVGPSRLTPDYYAWWVMNNVFGQYGLGGRLGDSIRERQGMAYYVFSAMDASIGPGPLVIRAGVSGNNVDRTLASIDRETALIASEGITERELSDAKEYLIGSLPRLLETNAGIATFLQTSEHFGLGLDHDQRLPELLAAVTRADVHRAARRLSPDRAAYVVAGPYHDAVTEMARAQLETAS